MEWVEFEGKKLPLALVKPHFYDARPWGVVKITAKWIVTRDNEISTSRYDREKGYAAGAFRDRTTMAPSKLANLEELNKFAVENGGTWDSGWKRKKSQ